MRSGTVSADLEKFNASNLDADGIQAVFGTTAQVGKFDLDPFDTSQLTVDVDYTPPNRLYIDKDWSLYGVDAINVDKSTTVPINDAAFDIDGSTTIAVTGSGTLDTGATSFYYITLDPHSVQGPIGMFTDRTAIRTLYAGSIGIDVMGFLSELITRGPTYANDGSHPFLRDTDIDTTYGIDGNVPDQAVRRNFQLVKSVSVEDVVAEELKLTAHMWFTTEIGKLGFRPIPLFTGTTSTTKTITTADILTPEGGQGEWPGYEIQSQGIVGVVNIKSGYDPAEDTHKGQEYQIVDRSIIGTHKKRGMSEITIAPKSNATTPPSPDISLDLATAQSLAARMMSVFGREYATVRVKVPFTKFSYLISDIVSLTCPQVPNTSGTRGVTNKRACVIGRKWSLDPKTPDMGELDLLILLAEPSGYAPCGLVTGQTNTTGTTWTVTLSSANAVNVLLSPSGSGKVCDTFAAGDYVRVVQRNASSPTIVTGLVSSVTSGSDIVTVVLDGAWTPGASSWVLEYQNDSGSTATATQRAYAYLGDATQMLASSSPARRFQ
jgi:hypothetical protein